MSAGAGTGAGTPQGGGSAGKATMGGAAGTGGTLDLGSAGDGAGASAEGGQSGEGAAGSPADTAGEGGDGGTPSHEGTSGAGGEPAQAECDRDSDCDDEVHCNGSETCAGGACRPGLSPCEDGVPEHCSVRCEEGASAATCILEPLDGDEDGYGTPLCTANPGDDCDDEDGAVNPGALEVCDEIDNDCDGDSDLDDGLTLAGQTSEVAGAREVQLAWSPAGNRFHLVYLTAAGIHKATLGTNGLLTPDAQPFAIPDGTAFKPGIATGSASVLATYHDARRGVSDYFGRTLSPGGTVSAQGQHLISSNLVDISWRETSGDWAMAYFDGAIRVASVAADLTVTPGGFVAESASTLRIATTGDRSAVVWQTSTNSPIRWAHWSASLVSNLLPGNTILGQAGYNPEITSGSDKFAIAWTRGAGLDFALTRRDGVPICRQEGVNLGLVEGSGNRVALANTERGVLALVTSEARGTIDLVRFASNCEVRDVVRVASASSPTSPAIDAGAGMVGLTWSSASGGGASHAHVVSDRLCE